MIGNTLFKITKDDQYGSEIEKIIKISYRNGIKSLSYEMNDKGVSIKIDNGNLSLANIPGIYAIFKEDRIIYIGSTKSSIRYRLYRFGKQILGRNHPKEDHSAGKKYRNYYGEDLNNLSIMYCEMNNQPYYNISEIEYYLIRKFNPQFNKRKIMWRGK